jgi:transcriptional regulator with XRE-family HTH domain
MWPMSPERITSTGLESLSEPHVKHLEGLSQAELAARMGTSQSTIARLENGQTLPSIKTILRYAEATGSPGPRAALGGLKQQRTLSV